MARKEPKDSDQNPQPSDPAASASIDDLLQSALRRDDDSLETGRYLVTFKESAVEEGIQALGGQGMRLADVREFEGQAGALDRVGDADAVVFPEIGVALVGGNAAQERGLGAFAEIASDGPIASVDPEYFVFAEGVTLDSVRGAYSAPNGRAAPGAGAGTADFLRGYTPDGAGADYGRAATAPGAGTVSAEYVRGLAAAVDAISRELRQGGAPVQEIEEELQVLGATWGLNACRVPSSLRSGAGIRVAVLDTGFDLGHPDFLGRPIAAAQFVGEPVQDGHGHGTHVAGTACGPRAPAGTTPRYGVGYKASMFIGKVLRNNGFSVGWSVLNGMNWAIAQRCPVISMSLGSQVPPQPYYTAAGQSALNNGLLIIAAAGNAAAATGAPANSPTIMSVASLDATLTPSAFSNFGKIDISGPGRDVFSSWPRPRRYHTISGTSMAAPHVSGVAALWAESSPGLRGPRLWRQLLATARRLPLPPSRVGAGLVQAP